MGIDSNGKLVKTINGNIENSASASLSRDFFWDGKDDFGEKLANLIGIICLLVWLMKSTQSQTHRAFYSLLPVLACMCYVP